MTIDLEAIRLHAAGPSVSNYFGVPPFRAGGVQRNAAPNLFRCHPRNQTVFAVRDGWIWVNPCTP